MGDPTTGTGDSAGACAQCGHRLQAGQNFCASCGSATQAVGAAADPHLGQVVAGKFRIDEVLGAGSMGVVYRARQLTLGKDVAIKILRRRLVADRNVVRRFKQEARAASRLSHPNTIQILDFGEIDGGDIYMAMECVDGRDLATVIRADGPLRTDRIVRLFTQVCSALAEAHDAGIVHRDLKPANILVTTLRSQHDFVKVLDFGIAKMLDPDPTQSIPMTREGFVCGTPAFMSPEQIQGQAVDGRSDLFSLGVCLYQALTGRLPFQAPTPLELATALVVDAPPPPGRVRPEWRPDPALERICLRLLEKRPDDRFPDAVAVIAALEPATASSRPPAPAEEQAPKGAPGLSPAPGVQAPARPPDLEDAPPTVEMPRRATPRPLSGTRSLLVGLAAAVAGFALVTGALQLVAPPAAKAPARGGIEPRNARPAAAAPAPSPPPEAEAEPVEASATPPGAAGRPERAERKNRVGRRGSRPKNAPADGPAGHPVAHPVLAPVVAAPVASPMDQARRLHSEATAALSEGRHEVAIRLLREAVAAAPGYGDAHRDLGKLYIRRREHDLALRHYRRYIEIAPDSPDAPAYRAIIRQYE